MRGGLSPNPPMSVTARKLPTGEWYWINRAVIQDAARIGIMGIAVYNVLASMANRNQECFPSQKHIADCLGRSRATVNRALKVLVEQGFVATAKRGPYRCCTYRLLEPRCNACETEMSHRRNRDVHPVDTNKNQLTRINNDIFVCVKKEELQGAIEGKVGLTREELLARDLAGALAEPYNLAWYRSLARRYPESLLRQTLSEVRAFPESAIRKNHPALFTHALKKLIERTPYDPGRQSRNETSGRRGLQGR